MCPLYLAPSESTSKAALAPNKRFERWPKLHLSLLSLSSLPIVPPSETTFLPYPPLVYRTTELHIDSHDYCFYWQINYLTNNCRQCTLCPSSKFYEQAICGAFYRLLVVAHFFKIPLCHSLLSYSWRKLLQSLRSYASNACACVMCVR